MQTEWIVTRPQHQGEELVAQIKSVGCPSRHIPLLTISQLEKHQSEALQADKWIFISPNAVQFAQLTLSSGTWRSINTAEVFAVGESTAKALRKNGIQKIIVPKRVNSEGLLELPELQSVKNQRIIQVCGQEGRTLIVDTLTKRGAQVIREEVYRRDPISVNELNKALADVPKHCVWIITSESALDVLGRCDSQSPQLLVSSHRLADKAKKSGMSVVGIAYSAQNEHLIQSILQLTTGNSDER